MADNKVLKDEEIKKVSGGETFPNGRKPKPGPGGDKAAPEFIRVPDPGPLANADNLAPVTVEETLTGK